ncbi:unnamed protein product [Heterobilharzia americana]|nr:unnamed protein product [Heterobilharzia americana]CAH8612680.1 unnamed protein product [Heterobilharzia americana]
MGRLLDASRCIKLLKPICRKMACYHIEWKPRPYPCTKEEREAAARRYNLMPSDYKPFEENSIPPGDYFYTEPYNVKNLDPWEHYDYPRERRNFGDPVQFLAQAYTADGFDPVALRENLKGQPIWWVLIKIFSPFIGFLILLHVCRGYSYFYPMKAKQFPYAKDMDKHYTFDIPE